MIVGVFYGIVACMIWGFVYIAPILLPTYDVAFIATGRYLVFGVLSAFLAWRQWDTLKAFTRADWAQALWLGVVGNIIFYCVLSLAVRFAGASVAGIFTALLPVSIAIVANRRAKKLGDSLTWSKLMPPLCLVALGTALSNWTEFLFLIQNDIHNPTSFFVGVGFALLSVVIWTWYPIANAEWLIKNHHFKSSVWSTAQGVALLPCALLMALFLGLLDAETAWRSATSIDFIAISLILGVLCSWWGLFFWSKMSQRLPPALGGQMIIFESIFAITYAYMLRGTWPSPMMLVGMGLLVMGVAWALSTFQKAQKKKKVVA